MNYRYILMVAFLSFSMSQVSVTDIESITNEKIDQMIKDLKPDSDFDKEKNENITNEGLPQEVNLPTLDISVESRYFGKFIRSIKSKL